MCEFVMLVEDYVCAICNRNTTNALHVDLLYFLLYWKKYWGFSVHYETCINHQTMWAHHPLYSPCTELEVESTLLFQL